MKRILIVLTAILLSSVVAASHDLGKFKGCPSTLPGCPGYEAKEVRPISTASGPMTIRGNPKATRGRWGERSYMQSCYWEANVGNVCMQDGRLKPRATRFYRKVEQQQLQRSEPKMSVARGPDRFGGNLGMSFPWRGESTLR